MPNDPEVERLRVYIRQLEDELDKVKKSYHESARKSVAPSMHSAGV